MNVLKPDKKAAIITLLNNGISQREIHSKVRVDRKTIRKYARIQSQCNEKSKSPGVATGSADTSGQNPPPRPPAFTSIEVATVKLPKHARSACEHHRPWIEEQVRLGRNAMAIYQDLVECFAFEHKYNSVKRFVRCLKKKSPKQYDRLEFLPGEEAQVDYGQGALTLNPKTGKYRRPRLFIMTLKYSRRSFRKVVWKSGQEVWARLHEEAFRYFGGCPQYVVLDNLKEGVIKPDIYEPELNAVYAAVLSHYGVVADPCRVADPNRKGTVESAIQHTQDTALKGRRFETIKNQNQWLMHWEENWASKRVHGRTKRQVEEMFQEEKPHLMDLPLTQFAYFSQVVRTVQDDGLIQINNCFYAALPASLHSKVIVRIYMLEIEIIDPQTLEVIRRHPKSLMKGMVFMDEKDRIFNPSRQTHYLFAKAAEIGPHTKELCKALFNEEGRPGQRRMRGIVDLARKFEAGYIEQAARIAVSKGLRKCRVIRRLVQDISNQQKPALQSTLDETLIQKHQLIRPPEDYALFFEQHAAGTNGNNNKKTLH
jgi:transposase